MKKIRGTFCIRIYSIAFWTWHCEYWTLWHRTRLPILFFIPPTKCTKLNNLQQSAIVLHLEELNRLNTIESQKQNIQTIFSVQIITNGRFGGEKQTSVELKYLFQFRKYMKNVCVWLVTRLTVRKFDFLAWNHFKRFGEQQELFNWTCQ